MEDKKEDSVTCETVMSQLTMYTQSSRRGKPAKERFGFFLIGENYKAKNPVNSMNSMENI